MNVTTQTAATLIRDARTAASLTQAELAGRAGMTQSVISAYEHGRREPSFATLQRLIAAAGYTLDASLVRAEPADTPLLRHDARHRHGDRPE